MPEEYVRVGKRKEKADAFARRLSDEGMILQPVAAHGKKIASSFWGYAWCRAIENWQDYESRLPSGRSLLRNGGVIHLEISRLHADAYVADDMLHHVRLLFQPMDEYEFAELKQRCAGGLTGLMDLIRGDLSEEIIAALCEPDNGLFPRYGEFKAVCDCIDDAVLCRHAAAVLYGIGARLDDAPEHFFTLRGIEAADFFDTASAIASQTETDDAMAKNELENTFGIELD